MARLLSLLLIAGLTWTVTASAQSNNGDNDGDSASIEDRSALENSRAGRVSERAPGNWIRSAIGRHNNLINARVRGPLSGLTPDTGDDQEADNTGSTGAGGGTTGGDLSGLLGLVNQFGGALGNLTSLFGGGTTGSLGGTTGGATGNNTTSAGDGSTTNTGGNVDPRLAALLALQEAAGSGQQKSVNQQQAVTSDPKFDLRAQDNGASDRKFTARLVESWASAFFSAATLAFQTNDFVNLLKDAIRPLMFPNTEDTDGNGDGDGDTDGDGNNGGSDTPDDDPDGDNTGGGIEDIPTGNNGDGTDSTI